MFFGIVCMDYALPEGMLIERLRQAVLFDWAYINLPPFPIQRREDVAVIENRSEMTKGELQRVVFEGFRGDEADYAVSQVTPVPGHAPRFVVPASLRDEGSRTVLVVEWKNPTAPVGLPTRLAAIVFSGLALATLIGGVLQSLRARTRERRVHMLRNLQVGVVEVSEHDEVRLVNERAEEILGEKFSRQSQLGAEPVRFGRDLIMGVVVPEDPHRVGSPLIGSSGPDWIEYEEITKQRRSGIASSYFARLQRVPDRGTPWIRVSATPVVASSWAPANRRRKSPPTFGVIEEAAANISEALEGYWRRLQRE
jgi:hypothetical protein